MDHLLDSRFHVEDYIAMGRSQEPEGSITQFDFKVLNVDLGQPAETTYRIETAKTVEQIRARPAPAIRIIFAPTDSPNTHNVDELSELYRRYRFPTAYLFERHQSVTRSFGARTNDSWFHFLCKNIHLDKTSNGGYDIKPWGKDATSSLEAPSNGEDRSWITAGVYLSWALQEKSPHVVMMFFGTLSTMQSTLKAFLQDPRNANAIMCDPFALYIPVLQELWTLMDNIIWGLLTVYGMQEAAVLESAGKVSSDDWDAEFRVDFRRLHNMAMHSIHLKEGMDAMLLTMEDIQASHEELFYSGTPLPPTDETSAVIVATKRNLEYVCGLFRGTDRRLVGLGTKINNTINLAFNLTAQVDNRRARLDSRVMRKDSNSMRVIATLTMIFLPSTAVASIFGSNFFSMNNGSFQVSESFWVFWVVSLPLTLMTIWLWMLVKRRKGIVSWLGTWATYKRPQKTVKDFA